MAAAAFAQSVINITPFSGTEKENFDQFEHQLASALALTNIAEDQRPRYLHLHLTGGALLFYDQLAVAVQANLAHALDALRNRYSNANRRELHKINFQARKFDVSKESVEDFLTDLKRLAVLAYPGYDPPIVAERDRRVKEIFINGMPNRIKRKLLNETAARTAAELCDVASKIVIIDKLCPSEEFSAFNEVLADSQPDLIAAIAALTVKQDDLAQKLGEVSTKLENSNFNRPPQREQQNSQNFQRQSRTPNRNSRGFGGRGYQGNTRGRTPPGRVICRTCGRQGHMMRDCWFRESPRRNAQLPYRQYPKN